MWFERWEYYFFTKLYNHTLLLYIYKDFSTGSENATTHNINTYFSILMSVNKLMVGLTINYLVSKIEKTSYCICTNC